MIYDLILNGGRVVDPAGGIDGRRDIAIKEGKIAAVAADLSAAQSHRRIDVTGKLVTPGLIDMHTHVFEYVSAYGLNPDRAGLQSGCTTIVDMASAGAPGLIALRAYAVKRSTTDVRAFLNMFPWGTAINWLPFVDHIDDAVINVGKTVEWIEKNRDIVRGVKAHAEVGAVSRWGYRVIEAARQVADACGIPIYLHTGHLMPVKGTEPDPDAIIPRALGYLRPGDVIGHLFSRHRGAPTRQDGSINPATFEARDRGVWFELGHGNNFVFAVADNMLEAGLKPDLISSDLHGHPKHAHHDEELDYSMVGTMSKMWALGVSLAEVVEMSTVKPARLLGLESEKGSLAVGRVADITVLDVIHGSFEMVNTEKVRRPVDRKLLPAWSIIAGRPHQLEPLALPEFRYEMSLQARV